MKNRYLWILSLVMLLLLADCSFKSEPERVWNLRGKIVNLAESLKGIKYIYGGTEIYGFDCSGFVKYVYGSFGIDIPRTAKEQGKIRHRISFKKAKPGDIVVFKLARRKWHSAIYINREYFIHSPNGNGYVRREKFNHYWLKRLKSTISILDRY